MQCRDPAEKPGRDIALSLHPEQLGEEFQGIENIGAVRGILSYAPSLDKRERKRPECGKIGIRRERGTAQFIESDYGGNDHCVDHREAEQGEIVGGEFGYGTAKST